MVHKKAKIVKRIVLLVIALLLVIGAGVWWFTRLGTSDCTKYERYDPIKGECYYECDTDEQCDEIAKKVDDELDAYFKDSKTRVSKTKPESRPASDAPTTDDPGTVDKLLTLKDTGSDTKGTVYTVSTTGQLLPTPTEHDQQLWDLFVRIASIDTINERLASFEIFNDASNDSAASVWQSESNREKWHMNVNAAFEDDQKDLIHTMVHEYGHIVSLNTSQVRTTQGSCPRLELPEGCTKQGSYIDSFNQKFWAQYGTNAPEDYGSDQGQVDAFYNASPDSFVTEYAATNMVEDFAESWAYFVLRSKPSDDSEKSQKIRFMYEFKELVRERDRIRTQIRSDLQRRNLLH